MKPCQFRQFVLGEHVTVTEIGGNRCSNCGTALYHKNIPAIYSGHQDVGGIPHDMFHLVLGERIYCPSCGRWIEWVSNICGEALSLDQFFTTTIGEKT